MKRIISALLAAVIAVSGLTLYSVTAAAAEQKEQAVYLLGDVDLDGAVSVIDATGILRSLAELSELRGLQTALAQIDGKEMDIRSATLIQRYLAGINTDFPIGKPAGDENEGVIYTEKVMSHTTDGSQVVSQQDMVVLSTAYPDVAFISDKEAMQTYVTSLGYQLSDLVINSDETIHTFTLPNGSSVAFDYADKTMVFSDYSTFTTLKDSLPFTLFENLSTSANTLYKTQPSSKYFCGDPCAVTFDYSEVPMLRKDSDFLIPLQTFSDFFMTPVNHFAQYNGKATYMIPADAAAKYPDFWNFYIDGTEKREQISDALAQVNYYELCNNLEMRYGLRKAHDIDDFDSYFKRRGLKGEFLSGNVERIEKANMMMCTLLFEDFHSGTISTSPFFGGKLDLSDDLISPIYDNRSKKKQAIGKKRKSALGENPAPYERRGDTVFITFDEFLFSDPNRYYQEGFKLSCNPKDTVELFAYALKRLQNEDSDAKNVVVDITCNDGGMAIPCGFVIEALIGKCIICMQNPNTSALSQNVTKFDLNLDGVIDENDISMKAMGKNIAVVISDSSFSCGNLLPYSLNELDPDVLLLGQQSGGGACSVGYISNAIGSVMLISSEKMLVTMKNGYIHDINDGVAPEIPLSINRMFDRDYIVNVVNDYFG